MDDSSNLIHKSHGFGLEVLNDKVKMVDVAEAHDSHNTKEKEERDGRRAEKERKIRTLSLLNQRKMASTKIVQEGVRGKRSIISSSLALTVFLAAMDSKWLAAYSYRDCE